MKKFLVIFPWLIIILLLVLMMKTCKSVNLLENQHESNIEALVDSVKHYKNKHNENVAKVKVMVLNNDNLLQQVASKDRVILLLQAELTRVKKQLKNGGTVQYIETVTTIDKPADTIYTTIDSLGNSIYTDSLARRYGEWITGTITLGKDTSDYNLKIKNEFIGILYYEREKGIRNLFKPKHPVFELTNKNPYTYTTNLRVVNITEKPPSKFGLSVGPGISLSTDLKIRPTVSFIFGYKLL